MGRAAPDGARADPAPAAPTTRFTGRVVDYVAARPGYPDSLIRLLRDEGALAEGSVVADIGSGTGLSAQPFLRNGYTVFGVEPNAAMRAAAEAALGSFAGFRSVAGTAEQTGLEDGSVDLVVVAQAFHWFDTAAAKREADRILRPGGRACLVWNNRRTTDTAFLRGYESLLRRYGTDYDAVRRRTASFTGVAGGGGEALALFFGGGYARRTLENGQTLDLEGLRRRVRSASYVPAEGTPGHEELMAALTALFEAEARDGAIRIPYDLNVFLGRPR